MAIKAIIFDLGGVILKTKDKNLGTTIAKKLGVPYEKVLPLYHSEMNDRIDLGEVTQEEFNTYVVDALNISRDKRHLIDQVMECETFIDELFLDKVGQLRNDYKIGLLSNYSNDLRDKIEKKWEIGGAFDEIVISYEVGLLKPDAAIYQLMLDRLGVQPEEAVFVDDQLPNIEGARKVGLNTILHESREQVFDALREILEASEEI